MKPFENSTQLVCNVCTAVLACLQSRGGGWMRLPAFQLWKKNLSWRCCSKPMTKTLDTSNPTCGDNTGWTQFSILFRLTRVLAASSSTVQWLNACRADNGQPIHYFGEFNMSLANLEGNYFQIVMQTYSLSFRSGWKSTHNNIQQLSETEPLSNCNKYNTHIYILYIYLYLYYFNIFIL